MPSQINVDADPDTQDGAAACRRSALTEHDCLEMLQLLNEHFIGVTSAQFAQDLDEKDWVIRIRAGGRLIGFTTLQLCRSTVDGETVHVIYSGDTIMAPEAWGSPVLARAWIALVRRIQSEQPTSRWYWLLLSSGFRTYRFLPVFWREFWPRHDSPLPPLMTALRAQFATERFGPLFDPHTGVVRFPNPQRLRPSLAAVPNGKATDPHVQFFLSANPGHEAGDELVCLTELSDDNLTRAGERMIRASATT